MVRIRQAENTDDAALWRVLEPIVRAGETLMLPADISEAALLAYWRQSGHEAFVAEDALQCGFCTPGQVVTATALLARTPAPSGEEIREALAGNLCRCGAYPKIERAILRAAGEAR